MVNCIIGIIIIIIIIIIHEFQRDTSLNKNFRAAVCVTQQSTDAHVVR